jgi:ADP-ribose pyrophosphatase YjhB (NUDIX family)
MRLNAPRLRDHVGIRSTHDDGRDYRFCPRREAAWSVAQGDGAGTAVCVICTLSSIWTEDRGGHHHPDGGRRQVVRRDRAGYGKWVFPGGYVDRGEPLTTAAIREAREECGLEVRLDGLVNIYSYPKRAPVIVVYAATAIGGALCCDEECLETAEFDPAAIPWGDLAFRSTKDGLTDYLAGLLHPVQL